MRRLGQLSLVLWVLTVAVFGWFLIKGNTIHTDSSQRQVILLSEQEKSLVLAEMRTMLESTQKIVQGLAVNDRVMIQSAAKTAGMGSAIDLDPVFLAKLPLEFKTLGFSMHRDMDAIAQAVEDQVTQQALTEMLANTMTKCVACHASWAINVQ